MWMQLTIIIIDNSNGKILNIIDPKENCNEIITKVCCLLAIMTQSMQKWAEDFKRWLADMVLLGGRQLLS